MDFTDSKQNQYIDFKPFSHGGMGKIYKGHSLLSQKPFILKLIDISPDSKSEKQERELLSGQIISHKNVVKVFDTGIKTIDGIEYLYLLEKYYSNGSLSEIITNDTPLERCYQMMYDLLLGLQEIHKTVIHRDLKPDNILIDDDGSLVISDYCLVRFITDSTHTETFKGWGSLKYMSPECWINEKNSPAMDIYSLGLIFFEILTGKSPYQPEEQTREGWRNCHLFSNVPDVSTYRNDVNVKLNQIIQKMTAKRLSERYKTIDEVLVAFIEARKQSTNENSAIEMLAHKANSVFEQITADTLKRQKAEEERKNYISLLNHHINDLFNRISTIITQINSRLETGQYQISKKSQTGQNTIQSLTVSLATKSFSIEFFDYSDIPLYNKQVRERNIENQKRQFGFVFQAIHDSFFKTNNIVLVGLAETAFKIHQYEFGFNLFLKKEKNSQYGEWFICQFSENTFPPRTSFGVSLNMFFNNFEDITHNPCFTKTERKLEDNDLYDLIKAISE